MKSQKKGLRIPLFLGQWRKNGWLQVLGWKWWLEGLFLLQVNVHYSYLPFVKIIDELSEIIEGWCYLEFHYHHTRTYHPWWITVSAPKEKMCPKYDWCPRPKHIRTFSYQKTWCLLQSSIRLFCLFYHLSHWVD